MNYNGKPPVPTKETHPLQGGHTMGVEKLGLQDIVRKLRNAGLSPYKIKDEINEKHLPPGAQPVNHMIIYRWIKKNMDNTGDLRVTEDQAINIYRSECELLKSIEDQIDIIEVMIDTLNSEMQNSTDVKVNVKDIKELVYAMDKLVARKHTLLMSVKDTQEKIYNYANFQEALKIILETVESTDVLLYADILEKMRNNAVLVELHRKIQPNK